MEIKKGQYTVEPSFEISEFVEKINKLSYHNFPVADVLNILQNDLLPLAVLEPYIFYSDSRYTRNLIHKTPEFEVVLLCWEPGQYSAIHGHEDTKSWMRIEMGALQIINFQEEPLPASEKVRELSAKEVKEGFVDGPADIHQLKNISTNKAISLHIYTKPAEAWNIYDLNTNQKMHIPSSYQSIHGKIVALERNPEK